MGKAETARIATSFGEVLRRHRTTKDLTQEELAFRTGVDRTYIYRLENGLRQPTISTLFSIAAALGVPSTQLLSDTEVLFQRSGRRQGPHT
jgi:transcriptional regulator with XRE-family HTH domain